ncbi:phosphopyruvate hydratase [Patescibacteria group bacterium]|nr:phosphopyruvate hydratase [Patescibacteria group bacterium]
MTRIKKIIARQILDSRGNPTVEADVILENDVMGRAAVPSGASTGEHEAVELRDGDKAYGGKGVMQACNHVEKQIGDALKGLDVNEQEKIDSAMIDLDGTPNKGKLGANAILAASMACARAAAKAFKKPLYKYLADTFGYVDKKWVLPVPMMNVINGGKHADNSTDVQEYMIVPYGADSLKDAVRMGAEIFHTLKNIIGKNKWPTTVGDEGGFAPPLPSNKKALDILVQSIEQSGYSPEDEVGIALDVAASEFFHGGIYEMKQEGKSLSTEEIIKEYEGWIDEYPILSIEDGLDQNDWDNWPVLEKAIGEQVMNVGDDFLVTNVKRLKKAIEGNCANAILIKLNQIGTLTETIQAIKMAQDAGWKAIVSHRSGETCDSFIADLVVACGTGYIKTGSLSRSERVEKYNQLMRIEEELGDECRYGLG